MGGSGGIGMRDKGGDDGGACEDFFEKTNLSGPNPDLLDALNVGDVLNLSLEKPQGPIVAKNGNGETVGSVTSASMLKLLRCMKSHAYDATITELSAGKCIIEIRHV